LAGKLRGLQKTPECARFTPKNSKNCLKHRSVTTLIEGAEKAQGEIKTHGKYFFGSTWPEQTEKTGSETAQDRRFMGS
jgi:hypothetical protein